MLRAPCLHFFCTFSESGFEMPTEHPNKVCNKHGYPFSFAHQAFLEGLCVPDTVGSTEVSRDTFKLITFKPHLPRSFCFIYFLFYLILTSKWCLTKNEVHQSSDIFPFARSIQNISLTFLLLKLLFCLSPQGHCELPGARNSFFVFTTVNSNSGCSI